MRSGSLYETEKEKERLETENEKKDGDPDEETCRNGVSENRKNTRQ
jgi:hypothetical protein